MRGENADLRAEECVNQRLFPPQAYFCLHALR
jgi:hypothetical protein